MDDQKVLEELKKVFLKVFKYKNFEFFPSLSVNDIQDWSSLKHILFIDAIEKHFDIKFKLNEVIYLKTMKEICRAIQEKTNDK